MISIKQAMLHYDEQFNEERVAQAEQRIDAEIADKWCPGIDIRVGIPAWTTAREIDHLRVKYREGGWITHFEDGNGEMNCRGAARSDNYLVLHAPE